MPGVRLSFCVAREQAERLACCASYFVFPVGLVFFGVPSP